MTQAEFCREHGISVGILHYWRRKAQIEGVESQAPVFSPVRLIKPPAASSQGHFRVEMEFPGQVALRLGPVSASDLAVLISELRRTC